MHIALTADPELAVPPLHYGGIERIVDMLAHGLTQRGHRVTLFANADSTSAGALVPWPGHSNRSTVDTLRNAATLARHTASSRFDVVHSFSRLATLLPILAWRQPKLMTYQRTISRRSVQLGHHLSRGTLAFSAISRFMMLPVADVGNWHVVSNGVPLTSYRFVANPPAGAPLVFLGRIEAIKGPHLAIEVARRAGLPLVIAGTVPDAQRGWFERHVAPHIDGTAVRYAGPIDDGQKNVLLGAARALLMPILWEEPFGIVMAEAMACGTPVIGFARGALPEVVENGVTGMVVADLDEMIAAVSALARIDRRAVRSRVERLYSDAAVVEGYLAVYEAMLGINPSAQPGPTE